MIRKTTNGDISDEEFNAILKPFLDNYDEYIESYIMPEVIAYYIANSHIIEMLCMKVPFYSIIILLKI